MNTTRSGPRRGTQLTLLLVVLVMLIISGYFVASYVTQWLPLPGVATAVVTPPPAPVATESATDLRLVLNATELSFNAIAEETAKSAHTRVKDYGALTEELNTQGVELSLSLGKRYGQLAQEKVLALWEQHSSLVAELAVAAKQGNQKSKKIILSEIEESLSQLAREIARANNDLTLSAVEVVMAQYLHSIEHIIDTQDPVVASQATEPDLATHTADELVEITRSLSGRRVPVTTMGVQQSYVYAEGMRPDTIVLEELGKMYIYNQDTQAHEFSMGKGNDYGKDHDHQIAPEYFKTEAIAPGEVYELSFATSGLYFLHDHNNPDIVLTVIVYPSE